MSSGPASEVDAFKRSVQGGFRNHMKNQMHFYHLLGLYFHFRWALHEKSQYFNFGPFPNCIRSDTMLGYYPISKTNVHVNLTKILQG